MRETQGKMTNIVGQSPSSAEAGALVLDFTLQELQEKSGLGLFQPDDVVQLFAKNASTEGGIDIGGFAQSINTTMTMRGEDVSVDEYSAIVRALFDMFDQDHNGVVDFAELTAGLSVLCAGSRAEKIKAAFDLYDRNGDGYISLEELTRYLVSVFRMLYATSEETRSRMAVSPEDLARVTAEQCFLEADLNADSKLNLEEFTKWFNRSPDSVASAEEDGGEDDEGDDEDQDEELEWLDLKEARRLSCLKKDHPEDVFEDFAVVADNDGMIDHHSFLTAWFQIVNRNGGFESESEYERAETLFNRLFKAFDSNGDGFVDFSELSAGLTVLSGGSHEDKVKAAFDLFDYNDDGYISLPEMITYLTSVFKVLYQAQPGTADSAGVSAEELAQATAVQAFEDADLNHDGRLSFSEFQIWYLKNNAPAAGAASNETVSQKNEMTLSEAKRLTCLDQFDVHDVFAEFAIAADEEGLLSRASFTDCFKNIIHSTRELNNQEEAASFSVIDRLFDLFDSDGNGVVDFSELASGLSVLCGGSRDEKARAAFSLFDYNGDGFITLEEMTRYLTSVFKVMYETQPGTADQMGVSAEDLATVTAEQAFEDADLNHDGRLSFAEFQKWYGQAPGASGQDDGSEDDLSDEFMNLPDIRARSGLDVQNAQDVFAVFSAKSSAQGLDLPTFKNCMATYADTSDDYFHILCERIFTLFDADHNGFVDFAELASGLTVLCGGTDQDKVRAAFKLYDVNGDGYISMDEMTQYLHSVFRVMYSTHEGMEESIGASSAQLAAATAQEAFANADLNHDGRLSFEEFKRWYDSSNSSGEKNVGDAVESKEVSDALVETPLSLDRVKNLTKLAAFDANEVYEIFSEMSPSGGLTEAMFTRCFNRIITLGGGHENEADARDAKKVVASLFKVFDSNGNGSVDSRELASGISVLCAGQRDEKIRAAFSLFDLNDDGFISLGEMTTYLTSVFKVLYESNNGTKKAIGVSADELGKITAEEAFVECDLNHDGRLSFDEFKKWYTNSGTML